MSLNSLIDTVYNFDINKIFPDGKKDFIGIIRKHLLDVAGQRVFYTPFQVKLAYNNSRYARHPDLLPWR